MTTETERKLARDLIKTIKALQPSRAVVGRQLVEKILNQSVSIPLFSSSAISESKRLR